MTPTILRLIATQQLNYTPLQYHSILVTPQQLGKPIESNNVVLFVWLNWKNYIKVKYYVKSRLFAANLNSIITVVYSIFKYK